MAGYKDKYWIRPYDMDKFYVYALYDANGWPFYIGKGKGYRVNNHLKPILLKERCHKNHKILKLLSTQGYVKREILAYFDSEDSAYDYESFLIGSYGLSSEGGLLTNVSKDRYDLPKKVYSKEIRSAVAKKQSNLSREQAISIIAEYDAGGVTQKDLADKYNVSSSSIGALLCGVTKLFSDIPRNHVPNPVKKITADIVADIKSDKSSGYSIKKLTDKYGIGKTHLYRILRGEVMYLQQTPGEGTSKSPIGQDDATIGNMENKSKFRIVSQDSEKVVTDFNGKVTVWSAEDWKELQGEQSD